MNVKEKRAADRFTLAKAPTVALEFEDLPAGFGTVANISMGGACVINVSLDVGLDVGAKVRLTLCLPNGQTVNTAGELRWIQQDPSGKSVRCGLQFEPGLWTDDHLKSLIAENAAI